AELVAIQDELPDAVDLLGSYPSNGYLFVDVLYDDGQIQHFVDEAYGDDVVTVRSALRELG
ncbi:MAG: hypothetical protein LH605_06880, partial [Microbacteriaceae bacterium]|nr:hypothetical protein [Microbacteriaceae bacterium]